MAQINIRMDDNVKKEADRLFEAMGLNMGTAVNMFIRQTIRQKGLPFEVTAKEDPFYSESNMRALRESIKQADEGKLITKTMDELRAMEDED